MEQKKIGNQEKSCILCHGPLTKDGWCANNCTNGEHLYSPGPQPTSEKCFVKKGITHKIIKEEDSETLLFSVPPSPCTDYIAKCGVVGLEHGQDMISGPYDNCAQAFATTDATPCPKCYPASKVPETVLHEESYQANCPNCGHDIHLIGPNTSDFVY